MGKTTTQNLRSAKPILGFTLVLLLACAVTCAAAQYNLATEFSATSNPSGVWSFGYVPSIGGDFTVYSTAWTQSGVRGWGVTDAVTKGSVNKNTSGAPVYDWLGFCISETGQVCANPSSTGEMSVTRWTAPSNGLVVVSAKFTGQYYDFTGTLADVYVVKNGATIWTRPIDGFVGIAANSYVDAFGPSPAQTYDGAITVSAGDNIDFVVASTTADAASGLTGEAITLEYAGSVAGIVTNSYNSAPVGGATVRTTDGAFSTKTAANGTYTLSLPTGDHSIECKGTDFVAAQADVTVAAGATANQNFTLDYKTSFDLAGDFADANPNGSWTLLVQNVLGVDVHNCDVFGANTYGIRDEWYYISDGWLPRGKVMRNFTTALYNDTAAENIQPAGGAVFEVANFGHGYDPYTVARWKAPRAAQVTINATFTGNNYGHEAGKSDSNAAVSKNGLPLWQERVVGYIGGADHDPVTPETATRTYSTTFNVGAGDAIDFAAGGNGLNVFDYVGVDATITVDQWLEPGSITGTIRSSMTGNPGVAGAKVQISGGGASATTGADGTYTITGVVPGDYTVVATAPEYESASGGVTVTSGGTGTLDLSLNLRTSFDLAGDFSNKNPNGAWKYLMQETLGTDFLPLDTFGAGVNAARDEWYAIQGGWLPRGKIMKNTTASLYIDDYAKSICAGGKALFEVANYNFAFPNAYTVARWTAPYGASITINSTFSGQSYGHEGGKSDSDVILLRNGMPIWQQRVVGFIGDGVHPAVTPETATKTCTTTLDVGAGDKIDFVAGGRGLSSFDYIGVDAAITVNGWLEPATITGKVKIGLPSSPPVSGAEVRIASLNKTTTSGADGTYTFGGLLPGTYTVSATHPDYAAGQADATVDAGETATLDLALTPKTTYSLAQGFSSKNPSGSWQYFVQNGLGTDVHIMDVLGANVNSVRDEWYYISDGWLPRGKIMKNFTSSLYVDSGAENIQPGGKTTFEVANFQFYYDPYTVARWTAPYAAEITISSTFTGNNFGHEADKSDSNAAVSKNGVPLWQERVVGFIGGGGYAAVTPETATRACTTTIEVAAGDRIDFAAGGLGANMFDYIGVDATITVDQWLAPGTIAGTVRAALPGDPAIAGAKVTVVENGLSAVTAADGTYSIGGLIHGAYTIEVTHPDYNAKQANVTVNTGSTSTADVALDLRTTFDLATDYAWDRNPNGSWKYLQQSALGVDGYTMTNFQTGVYGVRNECWALEWGWVPFGKIAKIMSGADPFVDDTAKNICGVGKTIFEVANPWFSWANYTTARWTAPCDTKINISATFTGNTWAQESGKSDSNAAVVLNGTPLWQQRVVGFIGGGGHAAVSPETATQSYSGTITVAKGDKIDFAAGGAGPNMYDYIGVAATITIVNETPVTKLAELMGKADGTVVSVTEAKVVSAGSTTFTDGSFYIQEMDRAAGMKAVLGTGVPAVALGDKVILKGILKTDASTMRYIEVTSVTKDGASVVAPLGVTQRGAMTGPSLGGLLIRGWGKVTFVDAGGAYAYIDDGSALMDQSGEAGVRVILSGLATPITKTIAVGDSIAVTGIAGLADNGGIPVPVIRPRGDADIDIL